VHSPYNGEYVLELGGIGGYFRVSDSPVNKHGNDRRYASPIVEIRTSRATEEDVAQWEAALVKLDPIIVNRAGFTSKQSFVSAVRSCGFHSVEAR
jgi:hypothetical protein